MMVEEANRFEDYPNRHQASKVAAMKLGSRGENVLSKHNGVVMHLATGGLLSQSTAGPA